MNKKEIRRLIFFLALLLLVESIDRFTNVCHNPQCSLLWVFKSSRLSRLHIQMKISSFVSLLSWLSCIRQLNETFPPLFSASVQLFLFFSWLLSWSHSMTSVHYVTLPTTMNIPFFIYDNSTIDIGGVEYWSSKIFDKLIKLFHVLALVFVILYEVDRGWMKFKTIDVVESTSLNIIEWSWKLARIYRRSNCKNNNSFEFPYFYHLFRTH